MAYRYFLKADFTEEVEVTKKVWIEAERNAGFRPKLSSDDPEYMNTCATAGFDGGFGVTGRLKYVDR